MSLIKAELSLVMEIEIRLKRYAVHLIDKKEVSLKEKAVYLEEKWVSIVLILFTIPQYLWKM